MEDFKARLLQEYKELEERFIKLRNYLETNPELSEKHLELLFRQSFAMEKYLEALYLRLEDLNIPIE